LQACIVKTGSKLEEDQAVRKECLRRGEIVEGLTLEEIFDIARCRRHLVVSTVNESGTPEAALMGFALTQAKEIVFDTLSTSRKAVAAPAIPQPIISVLVRISSTYMPTWVWKASYPVKVWRCVLCFQAQ
jgi:hypothetical protein